MAKRSENQSLFNLETPAKPQGPVECLGMTFENDEVRREHFLGLLNEGLEDLHTRHGGVPFTMVNDAVEWMKTTREVVLAQISDSSQRTSGTFRQQTLRKLTGLKNSHVLTYLAMHTQVRLDVNEDRRKVELMNDKRLKILQKLSTIHLILRQHLTDFQNRLAGLKSYFAITRQDLDALPDCPHCSFRPGTEGVSAPAVTVLDHLDEELNRLLDDGTQMLLTNLEDPTTRTNLHLLKPGPRKLVDTFLKNGNCPVS